jgi:hypothetical protein
MQRAGSTGLERAVRCREDMPSALPLAPAASLESKTKANTTRTYGVNAGKAELTAGTGANQETPGFVQKPVPQG